MTTNQKLNYIIQVLNELVGKSKTIGDLPDYTPGSQDITTFIGVYSSILKRTLKISIEDLLSAAANVAVGAHTHEINDVTSLGAALNPFFTDPTGNVWHVKRKVQNFDFSSLIETDIISGWEDDTTKTTWIEGVVLDATLILPADIYSSKFFITTKKIRT